MEINKRLLKLDHIWIFVNWAAIVFSAFYALFAQKLGISFICLALAPIRYLLVAVYPSCKQEMIDNFVNRSLPFATLMTYLNRKSLYKVKKWFNKIMGITMMLLIIFYNGYIMLFYDTKLYHYGEIKQKLFSDNLNQVSKEYHLLPREVEILQSYQHDNDEVSKKKCKDDVEYLKNMKLAKQINILGIKIPK